MSLLWGDLENKLNKSGRKWAESSDKLPYRYAELFCEECGVSLGMQFLDVKYGKHYMMLKTRVSF